MTKLVRKKVRRSEDPKVRRIIDTTQERLRTKTGEIFYTFAQLGNMLEQLDLYGYSGRMRAYATKHNLSVHPESLGVHPRAHGRYTTEKLHQRVAESNLQRLIDGLDICCTLEDLKKAAFDLGYLT